MAKVMVYGASDDLIEVEGDIREEFNHYVGNYDKDSEVFLGFSDGTLLAVSYGKGGIWRLAPVRKGSATFSKVEGTDDDGEYNSDQITLEGDITWVLFGSALVK